MIKKGIILAGGTGSRLRPTTQSVNKQLLMLFDKPVIFYPLSILMLSDIKDILIIVNSGQINSFKSILGDGSKLGIKISYAEQKIASGIPEAFVIGEKFIANENVALILGDNFFHGQSLSKLLAEKSKNFKSGANIFLKEVSNPESYGVAKLKNNKIESIIEKPKKLISNKAITGLYFFDRNVVTYSKKLKPSKRNETEITDVIKIYHKKNTLDSTILGLGSIWSDTGTVEDMHEVSNYVSSINKIQSFKIACLEEIALNKKWVTKLSLKKFLKKNMSKSSYDNYLFKILNL